jgi:hypothetical protein
MVVHVVVVVVLLLSVLSSFAPAWWWWCGSVGGVVASVDDWGCVVVDGVCDDVDIVGGLGMVWSGGFGTGGGGMGVGIWAGVCFGGCDVGCGGGSVYVVMCAVVCGGGGVVVVFYLHSLLPSVSPVLLMLSIFPAGSYFLVLTPYLWGL